MDGDRELLVLRAAQLYYYENLTQDAIANRMSCTRWTVGRLLEEARASGIVSITINPPRARVRELEKQIIATFGIPEAIVVRAQETLAATGALVAATTADYITGTRPTPTSLGIAWGRSLTAVARAMPDEWTRGLDVSQMYGGLVRSNDDEVADSIGLMARRGHGVGHMIPAPAIVTDGDLGVRLLREPSVVSTLTAAPASDLVIYSPGILEPESVLVRSGFLSAKEMEELRGLGAVTDLFSHFVDAQGRPVSEDFERRTIAVRLSAVRGAKKTVAIGWGPLKAEPLAVCMRSGLAKTLIVDEDTARGILEQA